MSTAHVTATSPSSLGSRRGTCRGRFALARETAPGSWQVKIHDPTNRLAGHDGWVLAGSGWASLTEASAATDCPDPRRPPRTRNLTMEQAIADCTRGLGIWSWAGNADDDPDVLLACAGDIPTLETLAAADLVAGRAAAPVTALWER